MIGYIMHMLHGCQLSCMYVRYCPICARLLVYHNVLLFYARSLVAVVFVPMQREVPGLWRAPKTLLPRIKPVTSLRVPFSTKFKQRHLAPRLSKSN